MKRLTIILTFFTLLVSAGRDFTLRNWRPQYGMVGVKFGPILPTGGDGHIYGEQPDSPHAEYGFFGGFDFWKKYPRSYDFHVGLESNYQQYHFHYPDERFDGYFRYLYLRMPVTINFPLRNYPYIFLKGGIALSSTNLLGEISGDVGPDNYVTKFSTGWPVYPELIAGIDFIEEKGKKVWFRAGVEFSFVPIKTMGQFSSFVSEDGQIESRIGTFTPNKFQLQLAIYPIWKGKPNIGGCTVSI